MNTSTPSSHTPPTSLTDEQLTEIEANNNLLKVFKSFTEDLEVANPGHDFPMQLLYTTFVLGAQSVARAGASVQSHIQNDIKELREVLLTLVEGASTPVSLPTEESSDAPI